MFGISPLAAVGAATLFAAILGIQLGNSAISAIKPSFFLGPAVHPRDRGAAIDSRELEARRLARLQTAYESLYGWNEGNRTLQLACPGCGDSVAEHHRDASFYDARVPYFGNREPELVEGSPRRREVDSPTLARLDAPELGEARSLEPYTDYPITQDDVADAALEKPEATAQPAVAEHDPGA